MKSMISLLTLLVTAYLWAGAGEVSSLVFSAHPSLSVRAMGSSPIWQSSETDPSYRQALADWDGDGDLDLLTTNIGMGARLYGCYGAQYYLLWSSGVFNTRRTLWGQLLGDYFLDILLVNYGQPLVLYQRMPGGVFQIAWQSPGGIPAKDGALADFDGDGKLDILVVGDNLLQLYRNEGGTFALVYQDSFNYFPANCVAIADWNHDHLPDFVVGTPSGYPLVLYSMQGPFQPSVVWMSNETPDTRDVAFADVNQDGEWEIITGNYGAPCFIYSSSGSLLSGSPFSTSVQGIAVGDLEGDGIKEIAFAGNGSSEVWRWWNGSWQLIWQVSQSANYGGVNFGDMDNDGDLDLFLAVLGGSNTVYLNDGKPPDQGSSTSSVGDARSLAAGDGNNDGQWDLFVGIYQGPNLFYVNNGGTLYWQYQTPESDRTLDVAWGDMDGDGDLDVAVANLGEPNRIYENQGGTFVLAWSSPEVDRSFSVAWGDADGDGDLDLAFGNDGEPNRVYWNTGGTFVLGWSSAESDHTRDVAWEDWDNDGTLELACANLGEPPRLYDGETGLLLWSGNAPLQAKAVAWADVDQDGFSDLLLGCWQSYNMVFYNQGGAFLPPNPMDTLAENTRAIFPWDIDGDGKRDILVVNDGQPSRWYEWEANQFRLAWSTPFAEASWDATALDFEGDGDLELIFAQTTGSLRVYGNGKFSFQEGLPETPTHFACLGRPGGTASSYGYSSAQRLFPPLTFPLNIVDGEYDTPPTITVQYSTDGGGTWHQATAAYLTSYNASPTGTATQLVWDTSMDNAFSSRMQVRVRVGFSSPSFIGQPQYKGDGWHYSPLFTLLPLRPGSVPNGTGNYPGLTIQKDAVNPYAYWISWSPSCASPDYALLYGDLSQVSQMRFFGAECSLGTTGSFLWQYPPGGNLFFLVTGVAQDPHSGWTSYGSLGTDSSGQERQGNTQGLCNLAIQDLSGTCPP